MKRGLKLAGCLTPCQTNYRPWTCPDEEGIETPVEVAVEPQERQRPWTCPDEEGIETVALVVVVLHRSGPWTCPDEEGIETLEQWSSTRRVPSVSVDMPR